MRISFLGAGNMGGALVRAVSAAGCEALVYDKNAEAAKRLAEETGAALSAGYGDLLRGADFLVVALKPNICREVLPEIRGFIESGTAAVSVAAGLTLSELELLLGKMPIIRAMPNINALYGASATALCRNELVPDAVFGAARERIFGPAGEVFDLPEKDFPAFTGIAGSAPAFAFMFINGLARAGVKLGLNKADALRIAAAAVSGSARTAAESGRHPEELADAVCSPAGTTIEGVELLLANGFEGLVMAAAEAAANKRL
ncbi:MAG: pyrroline-5-carboxylate reductase [Clostridiales bacterium]|nr:pyrroline-5-carboxylate reductase [Clostridiales bacterium]